jgi:hypothetical protein
MPKNVRNFWIEADVDGGTPIGAGPKSKDGGFSLSIFMRDKGFVKRVANISGVGGSELKLSIHTEDGKYLQYTTQR